MASLSFDIFATENVSGVIDKIADKLKDSEDDWGKWALAAGVAGGAIGGALVAGVAGAMDLQSANAKMAGQLGLSADQAARFGKIAGDVYSANYGESMDQVNETIVAITQQIGEGNDAWMQDTTSKILNVSSTWGQESGAVAAAVGQMLKTGMAETSEEALNVVTAGFQRGIDKSGDFLDTLNEYGTQFRKMGIDGTQATGLLSQGLQAGARDADVVADAIKEFSIRAIDGSQATQGSWEALGFSATEMQDKIAAGGASANEALAVTLDALRAMKDPSERAAIAVGLFGTQSEDLGEALYALDPRSAVQALGDVGRAATDLDKTLGSTGQANLAVFQRSLQTAFVEQVGGRALPAVMAFTGALTGNLAPAFSIAGGAVSAVTGFYDRHQVLVQSVAVTVGVLAGAVGAAALVQGIQTGALATWLATTTVARVATTAYTAVQWALNAAMSANPIGLVVVALAAVAAGVIYAYKHSETFRDIVDTGLRAVGSAFTWLGDLIGGWVGNVKTWLVDTVGGHVVWLQTKFGEFKIGLDVALGGARVAIGWIKDKAGEVKDWVGANWPLLLGILTGPIGLAVLAITKNWDSIKAGATGLVDRIKQMPGDIRVVLQGLFNPLWENFRSVANRIIGKWNSLSFSIGGGSFMGVDIPQFTIQTPNIPMLATGGTAVAPGLSIVGEQGPELAYLPTGASVIPLPRIAEAAGTTGTGDPAAAAQRAAALAEAADTNARLEAVERLLAALPAAFASELVTKLRQG